MTSDVLSVGSYLLLNTSVPKVSGYAIAGGGVPNVSTYAVAGGGVTSTGTYALYLPPYLPSTFWTVPYPFSNVTAPDCISFGSKGGPRFNTSIFSVDSGMSLRQSKWERIRAEYTIDYKDYPSSYIEQLNTLFYTSRGMAIGFLFKDWADYIISNQPVFIGDGITSIFQIFKRYESGGHTFDRIIKKPRLSNAVVAVNGVTQVIDVDYYISPYHGTLAFIVPPAVGDLVTIVYLEFDVPVRFDSDSLAVTPLEHSSAASSIKLVEVLL